MAMNDDLDPKILDRVRAMLAKAESSQFAEEAAAFTAKAQELMATYAIDRALLDAKDGTGQVISRRIIVAKPYSKNKARLLGAVARANRCRVIVGITEDAVDLLDTIDRNDSICTVFGHETDLDIVELLFTSLLLQATNVMLAHGSTHDGWSNTTRSFRHSFLIGFADVVAGRLQETQDFAVAESENSADLLPVLVSRAEKVDDAVEEAFPQLGTMRVSYSNTGGLVAGASAGHRADVGLPSVGGNRGSLTS
jgi:hypothetical protein